jgi:hypothetical protein
MQLISQGANGDVTGSAVATSMRPAAGWPGCAARTTHRQGTHRDETLCCRVASNVSSRLRGKKLAGTDALWCAEAVQPARTSAGTQRGPGKRRQQARAAADATGRRSAHTPTRVPRASTCVRHPRMRACAPCARKNAPARGACDAAAVGVGCVVSLRRIKQRGDVTCRALKHQYVTRPLHILSLSVTSSADARYGCVCLLPAPAAHHAAQHPGGRCRLRAQSRAPAKWARAASSPSRVEQRAAAPPTSSSVVAQLLAHKRSGSGDVTHGAHGGAEPLRAGRGCTVLASSRRA